MKLKMLFCKDRDDNLTVSTTNISGKAIVVVHLGASGIRCRAIFFKKQWLGSMCAPVFSFERLGDIWHW